MSITSSQILLRLMSIYSVMPSNHLLLCNPLSSCLHSFPESDFANESVLCIRWPKYWSFSFSMSPSNEYSGLISFCIDWFDLLTVQVTLKSLLQHHNSVQFSRLVMSYSLRPHELQCTRPPCSSSTPGVHPNPCPLSRWCHPNLSSSVFPFSSFPQSFPASGYFTMSQLFALGGQSMGVWALTSVLPMNTQDWFPLEWTGCISLQSKGLSRVFSNTTVRTHQFCTA